MSATVAAALKKIAVYILTDKKALKVVGGIILGIIIIIIMPIVALLGIFTGSVDIDTDRLHEMIAEQQSVAIESWSNVETAMTNAGYDSLRIQEAQALFTFALYDHASEPDFASKLVGCFAQEQTDEELISAVNAAFGTNIVTADFTNVMASTRAAYINSSGYTDPTTKNSTDLVMWAEFAHAKGWGYVWGTYGDVLDKNLFEYKKTQYPDEVGGKAEYMDGIIKKYHPDWIVKDKPATDGGNGISGQEQTESESHEPQQTPPKKPGDKKGGGGMNPVPPNRRTALKPAQEVKPNEPS